MRPIVVLPMIVDDDPRRFRVERRRLDGHDGAPLGQALDVGRDVGPGLATVLGQVNQARPVPGEVTAQRVEVDATDRVRR